MGAGCQGLDPFVFTNVRITPLSLGLRVDSLSLCTPTNKIKGLEFLLTLLSMFCGNRRARRYVDIQAGKASG